MRKLLLLIALIPAIVFPQTITITPQNGVSAHLKGTSGTPTIAAGTGAGTGPTVSVSGNDSFMQVSVTTGTAPLGSNAVIATITYNSAYSSTPHPVFSSGNVTSALLSGVSMVAMDGASTTTFTITSGTTALGAGTFLWNVVTGN